ncbi:MAG: 2-succinyl-5-enolpyruvyl-6-hydroxy-3-cyclohexene-1-carboxylic-acid synthase, partial [Chlamydiae bacterium]|nr:2-succinyl-5-enolpyruvyl-6-hydroxy-3-cyclohexene-1-carboxylic-acid synthase [Chlamydiota bacterium]
MALICMLLRAPALSRDQPPKLNGKNSIINSVTGTLMSLAEETLRRSYIIVQTLLHQGVSHFCLAPGSRSSPLAEAIYTLAKDSCLVHFDERGLGFYALGLAKASKKPVALLVTSGTAVANLLPAVVEASLSRVPLLLLTADRPFELRDCGANQTIEQTSIFSSYIHWKSDLPLSDLAISDACLQATFSYALWTAQKAPPGPVQINCMIREPLVSTTKPSFTLPPLCRYETVETLPSKESLVHWTRSLSSKQRGIILLGSDAIEGDPTPILELSARLKWPIFSDVLSGGRAIGPHPLHVQYPDLLLRSFPSLRIDAVLQLGDRLVSKTLTTWLRSQESLSYYLASTSPSQQDPDRLATHRIGCSGLSLAKAMIPLLSSAQETSPWLQFWEKSSLHVASFLSAFFAEQTAFTEPFIAHSLEQGSSLFLSNSMPIRDAEFFLFPTKKLVSIFANRGASGIDGNIATACGLAKGLGKPLIAVLGDMASLHDINSLAF